MKCNQSIAGYHRYLYHDYGMDEGKQKHDLSRLAINREAVGLTKPRAHLTILLVSSVFVIFVAALLTVSSVLKGKAQTKGDADTVLPDSLAEGQAVNTPTILNATGYVVAQRQAAVSSKATGRLKELNVVEGDLVRRDDVIGVLENDDLVALVRERDANVLALEAQIHAAQAELEEATLSRNRTEKLVSQNVLSQAELDQAIARHRKAVADVDSARANQALAKAQADKVKIELGYTYIHAPFDGTVLTKNADVGEIVAPFGSSSDARAAVVTIADMSSLEVEADVSETNISRVFVGQKCEIVLDSFPSKKYRGEVTRIVPTVDRAKATVLTKIKFLDLDDRVIPEMSAKVSFLEMFPRGDDEL